VKYLTVCQGALLALSLAVVSTSAFAQDYVGGGGYRGNNGCYKCPPPKNYDSQEVVKQTRDFDRSAVIETQSVVPSRRLIETNHLIIHENETRNVGTVQHNHTIIEKELVETRRNVDNKYVNTSVNMVENRYNTVRQHTVEERELPGVVRDLRECNCEGPVRPYGANNGTSAGVSSYGQASRYVKLR
jgi:hypothetical protein